MTHRLQQFGINDSAYERPAQAYSCGGIARGRPCPLGPDRAGRCRASRECRPIRKGDRWICTRPENRGGTCADGPMPDGACCLTIPPCQPIRSLRATRGRLALACFALSIGVVLVMVAGPWSETLLSPGPLISAHAGQRCASCHSASDSGLTSIFDAAFRLEPDEAHGPDSGRCLDCHQLGPHSGQAHGAAPSTLAEWTAHRAPDDDRSSSPVRLRLARTAAPRDARTADDLACATCHREHQGRQFNLASMSDAVCQSCHSNQFRSFSEGHPDFSSSYPLKRRTRIAFNHASHLANYFTDSRFAGDAPADCEACHRTDDGRTMLTAGFETSCGSCHQHTRQIRGEGLSDPTLAFFRLPALDLDTLKARGIWIGEKPWPSNANIGDEGELTDFMKLLLASNGDADLSEDFALLERDDVSLSNLTTDDPEETDAAARAAGRIVWAIQGLVYDLTEGSATDNQERLEALLARSIGRPRLGDHELAALTGLPLDAPSAPQQELSFNLKAMRDRWLPNLGEEVPAYRDDPGLLTRLEVVAPAPQAVDEAEAEEARAESDDDLFAEDDEALFDEDQDEDQDEDADLFAQDEASDDALFDEDDEAPVPAEEVEAAPPVDFESKLDQLQEDLKSAGRWHLDDYDYSLRYRPVGHADSFLKSWIDAAANEVGSKPSVEPSYAGRLLGQLMNAEAPGRCGRCHSLDAPGQDVSGRPVVNWRADRPDPTRRDITTFDHEPHLQLNALPECQSCHRLDQDLGDDRSRDEAYAGTDPHQFVRNFSPITKLQCGECHRPRRASDHCLACHRYHVTPLATSGSTTSFVDSR